MRFTHELITEIRRESRNVKIAGTNASIGDLEIIQYLNDAQDRMQSLLSAEYPLLFTAEQIITPVALQEAYTITGRVFLQNRIVSVEYSETGDVEDYHELEQRTIKERNTEFSEVAEFYIRRANQILINPVPRTTTPRIRVNYEKELDDLAIAIGNVKTTIAAPFATIDVDVEYEQAELEDLKLGDFIQVVDEHDLITIAYDDLGVTGYDAVNNRITVPAATPIAGHSITDGDYILKGRYVTMRSELPDCCERYLVAYATMRCLMKDRSNMTQEKISEVMAMEKDIIGSFGDIARDVAYIPILDADII